MIFKPAKWPKFFYLNGECLHRGDFEEVENSLVDNFRADKVRQYDYCQLVQYSTGTRWSE